MSEPSIQERLYPDLMCFGCGQANLKGLRLRSYPAEGYVSAEFTPWPEHDNGGGFLNGGIIATVLDCHSGAAVYHEVERRGLPRTPEVPLPYVTAGLDVRYLRPTPLHQTLQLRGSIESADEEQVTVAVELLWDGKARASATARWLRWRPRPR